MWLSGFPQGSILVSFFMFYVIVGKAFAENKLSTCLSSCNFLQKPFQQKGYWSTVHVVKGGTWIQQSGKGGTEAKEV